eukprot:2932779-Rhodomonas_salina.1
MPMCVGAECRRSRRDSEVFQEQRQQAPHFPAMPASRVSTSALRLAGPGGVSPPRPWGGGGRKHVSKSEQGVPTECVFSLPSQPPAFVKPKTTILFGQTT